MIKLNAGLVAMLLVCALLLVTSQHRARKVFIDLERAQSLARKQEVEWNRLQLEQTRLAKHSLIDSVARRELKLQPVSPDRTLYLNPPAEGVAGSPTAPQLAAAQAGR